MAAHLNYTDTKCSLASIQLTLSFIIIFTIIVILIIIIVAYWIIC